MVNKVILQGRLTKDVELKKTSSDIDYTVFTVAWSEKYKETEKKCFQLCKTWRGTATFLKNYFKKGQELIVEGQMLTENWGTDAEVKNVTFLSVEKVNFCGSKSGASESTGTAEGFMPIDNADSEECPFA